MSTPNDTAPQPSHYADDPRNYEDPVADTTPAPQWHRITPDNQPQFPCWLWHPNSAIGPEWIRWLTADWWTGPTETWFSSRGITHWHPDQPTAPTAQPSAEPDFGNNGGVKCDTDNGPCACGAWHTPAPADGTETPLSVEQQLDATTIDLQNALIDRAALQVDKNRLERELAKVSQELEEAKAEQGKMNDVLGIIDMCQVVPLVSALRSELADAKAKLDSAASVCSEAANTEAECVKLRSELAELRGLLEEACELAGKSDDRFEAAGGYEKLCAIKARLATERNDKEGKSS